MTNDETNLAFRFPFRFCPSVEHPTQKVLILGCSEMSIEIDQRAAADSAR